MGEVTRSLRTVRWEDASSQVSVAILTEAPREFIVKAPDGCIQDHGENLVDGFGKRLSSCGYLVTLAKSVPDRFQTPACPGSGVPAIFDRYNPIYDHPVDAFGVLARLLVGGCVDYGFGIEQHQVGGHAWSYPASVGQPQPLGG